MSSSIRNIETTASCMSIVPHGNLCLGVVVYVAFLLGSEIQMDNTLGTHGADEGFLAVSRMPFVWSKDG